MHQVCFDIHHLVLTTAKCQLIVPPPRKHNAGNIFRSQSFLKDCKFSMCMYLYACVFVCVCVHMCVCAFPVRKLNELLTLQKRSSSPLQQRRHQMVYYTAGSTHWTEAWIIITLVIPIIELGNSGGLTLWVNRGAQAQTVKTSFCRCP